MGNLSRCVLELLRQDEQKNTKAISDLTDILLKFGYELDHICKACNEMMQPAHQLVYSNAKTEYFTKDFQTADNDLIKLTKAGKGYVDKLLYDMDYIEMVMLDCMVETSDFPSNILYDQLLQRLKAVLIFLKILHTTDYYEMLHFKSTDMSLSRYYSNFGKSMLTWDIINNVCKQIKRILNSLESETPKSSYLTKDELRFELVDRYVEMENILNIAAQNSKSIFGEKVNYKTPTPKTDIIQQLVEKRRINLKPDFPLF